MRHASLARIALVIAGLTAASATQAQADPCDPHTFAPAYFRILEHCEARAALDPSDDRRHGLQALRYLSLDDDPNDYVSLGGEARLRWERLAPQRFGLAGGHDFVARGERLLLHADAHVGSWRAFVQLSAAGEANWPVARPADRSEPDIAQAFVDWQPERDQYVRLGRFELPFPTNRLVGVNDATNLRRAFQGAALRLSLAGMPLDAFATRPVVNKSGALDDHWAAGERFNGVNVGVLRAQSAALSGSSPALDSIDVFLFDRYRAFAQVQNGAGAEHVQTWGTRWAVHAGHLRAAVQATLQHGRLGDQRMDGDGVTLDVAQSFDAPWSPTISGSFGRASGDVRSGDGRIDTFDPLYANLAYSTDAGYFYPGNNEDLSIALTVQPTSTLQMQVGAYAIRRLQSHDAAYQPPGIVLVPGNGNGGQRLAMLPFFKTTVRVDRYDELVLSLVELSPSEVLRTAQARRASYALLQWTARF